jgi:hypothetical protein
MPVPTHFPDRIPGDDYRAECMLPTDAEGRYRSACIQYAIANDKVEAIEELVALGFLVAPGATMLGEAVTTFCRRRGAPKVAAKLAELGFS